MLKLRNWDGLTVLYRDFATDQSDMAQMDLMKSGGIRCLSLAPGAGVHP